MSLLGSKVGYSRDGPSSDAVRSGANTNSLKDSIVVSASFEVWARWYCTACTPDARQVPRRTFFHETCAITTVVRLGGGEHFPNHCDDNGFAISCGNLSVFLIKYTAD